MFLLQLFDKRLFVTRPKSDSELNIQPRWKSRIFFFSRGQTGRFQTSNFTHAEFKANG